MQKKPLILALLAGIALSGAAQAALVDRGGGLIYDTDLNITWLANANVNNGPITWDNAMTWANNLSYGGYSDWRLPATVQPDATCDTYGFNCTGSEMGHLRNELGGVGRQDIATTHNANYDLFQNVQSDGYWSGTEYAPSTSTLDAWLFHLSTGYQDAHSKDVIFYAWAVHPGDVAAVPEADTWAMLLAGLTLVGAAARRRRG